MNSEIDEFIWKVCDEECGEYFQSSKEHCFELVKEALPVTFYDQESFDVELQLEIAAIASPIIKKNNHLNKNRLLIYDRVAMALIREKYMLQEPHGQDKNAFYQYDSDFSQYVINRLFKYISKFDLQRESVVDMQVKKWIEKVYKQYLDLPVQASLNPILKEQPSENETLSVTQHYQSCLVQDYHNKAMDSVMGKLFLENALVLSDHNEILNSLGMYINEYDTKHVLLEEVFSQLLAEYQDHKPIIFYHLFSEFYNKHKFSSYFYTTLKNCHKDFLECESYQAKTGHTTVEDEDVFSIKMRNLFESRLNLSKQDKEQKTFKIEEDTWYNKTYYEDSLSFLNNDDLLWIFDYIPNDQNKLILKLKYGFELDIGDFTKVLYLLNYRKDMLLEDLDDEELLAIKWYVRNDWDEVSHDTFEKLSYNREKLKSHSYIDTDVALTIQQEIFTKLLYGESLKHQEIGEVFELSSRQIDKKIENVFRKLRTCQKEIKNRLEKE